MLADDHLTVVHQDVRAGARPFGGDGPAVVDPGEWYALVPHETLEPMWCGQHGLVSRWRVLWAARRTAARRPWYPASGSAGSPVASLIVVAGHQFPVPEQQRHHRR